MLASRMIPMIWFRLAVLIAFAIFVGWQGTWWVLGIAVVLMLITIWQLVRGYQEKNSLES
ncbi:hypothetical protein COCCU_07190 [Corynebacterium occultum]|uniref:Uncharacterized protein n=1 Tax=Corynebacterium occultum TaxID=2675219 RepID=A0A6B8VP76_9CORY|nr:hypothetical protein [Corynebacterium occultum]QGU07372.1 hypothetical protein COCCU_07190 [Corynebacterium occultum]